MDDFKKGTIVKSIEHLMSVRGISKDGEIVTNWMNGKIIKEGCFRKETLEPCTQKLKEEIDSDWIINIKDIVCFSFNDHDYPQLQVTNIDDSSELIECLYWVDHECFTIKLCKEQLRKPNPPKQTFNRLRPGAFGF